MTTQELSQKGKIQRKKKNVNYLQIQPRKIRKNTGMSTNYTKRLNKT